MGYFFQVVSTFLSLNHEMKKMVFFFFFFFFFLIIIYFFFFFFFCNNILFLKQLQHVKSDP